MEFLIDDANLRLLQLASIRTGIALVHFLGLASTCVGEAVTVR
jgi:hypothetical protein